MTKLVVIGSIGNCLDIIDAVRACNSAAGKAIFEPIGFLDDQQGSAGRDVYGLRILGPISLAAGLSDVRFVCGIGSPKSFAAKAGIIERIGIAPERFATIIHPNAVVSTTAHIGMGSVLLANSVVCAQVSIGSHVMMLPNGVVGHDSVIGDCVIMAGGVVISGNVKISASSYIGAAASIREGVSVGRDCLIGMGSVVVRDVPVGCRVAGNPARPIKEKGA